MIRLCELAQHPTAQLLKLEMLHLRKKELIEKEGGREEEEERRQNGRRPWLVLAFNIEKEGEVSRKKVGSRKKETYFYITKNICGVKLLYKMNIIDYINQLLIA